MAHYERWYQHTSKGVRSMHAIEGSLLLTEISFYISVYSVIEYTKSRRESNVKQIDRSHGTVNDYDKSSYNLLI